MPCPVQNARLPRFACYSGRGHSRLAQMAEPQERILRRDQDMFNSTRTQRTVCLLVQHLPFWRHSTLMNLRLP